MKVSKGGDEKRDRNTQNCENRTRGFGYSDVACRKRAKDDSKKLRR